MSRVVNNVEGFKILSCSRDYVIVNENLAYKGDFHAHFNTLDGCNKCIRYIREGKLPKSLYFKKAAKRLLTEEEFNALREQNVKKKYVNKKIFKQCY